MILAFKTFLLYQNTIKKSNDLLDNRKIPIKVS